MLACRPSNFISLVYAPGNFLALGSRAKGTQQYRA
jgi:hypothetical protein